MILNIFFIIRGKLPTQNSCRYVTCKDILFHFNDTSVIVHYVDNREMYIKPKMLSNLPNRL